MSKRFKALLILPVVIFVFMPVRGVVFVLNCIGYGAVAASEIINKRADKAMSKINKWIEAP